MEKDGKVMKLSMRKVRTYNRNMGTGKKMKLEEGRVRESQENDPVRRNVMNRKRVISD